MTWLSSSICFKTTLFKSRGWLWLWSFIVRLNIRQEIQVHSQWCLKSSYYVLCVHHIKLTTVCTQNLNTFIRLFLSKRCLKITLDFVNTCVHLVYHIEYSFLFPKNVWPTFHLIKYMYSKGLLFKQLDIYTCPLIRPPFFEPKETMSCGLALYTDLHSVDDGLISGTLLSLQISL